MPASRMLWRVRFEHARIDGKPATTNTNSHLIRSTLFRLVMRGVLCIHSVFLFSLSHRSLESFTIYQRFVLLFPIFPIFYTVWNNEQKGLIGLFVFSALFYFIFYVHNVILSWLCIFYVMFLRSPLLIYIFYFIPGSTKKQTMQAMKKQSTTAKPWARPDLCCNLGEPKHIRTPVLWSYVVTTVKNGKTFFLFFFLCFIAFEH